MRREKFCQSCMLPKDNELFEKATEKDGFTPWEFQNQIDGIRDKS